MSKGKTWKEVRERLFFSTAPKVQVVSLFVVRYSILKFSRKKVSLYVKTQKAHLNVIMTLEEKETLTALAKEVGVSESDFLRKLIRHKGIIGVPLLEKDAGGKILDLFNDVSNQLSLLLYRTQPGSLDEHKLLEVQVLLAEVGTLLAECLSQSKKEGL